MFSFDDVIINEYMAAVYWIRPVRPSVVRLPSIRDSIGVPGDNSNSFHQISKMFGMCITWVIIMNGTEYQLHTSLDMCTMIDHVAYTFLAFGS